MTTFPDEWRALSQPHVRFELMEFLKSTTDPTQLANSSELQALVHFIFDDHDFAPDANELVGLVLLDAAEAELLNLFVKALDRAIGPGRSWPRSIGNDLELRTATEEALRTLVLRGEPKFSP